MILIVLKKLLLFFILCSVCCKISFAYTLESRHHYIIQPGLTYQEYTVSPIDGWLKLIIIDPQQFELKIVRENADHSDEPKTLSQLATKHQAIAAINGGFFHFDPKVPSIRPAVPLKINHQWINRGSSKSTRGAVGWMLNNSKIDFDRIQIKAPKKNTSLSNSSYQVLPVIQSHDQLNWAQFDYIVGGAPLLRLQNKTLKNIESEKVIPSFINEAHARTLIGLTTDHHWMFMNTSELNLYALQQILGIKQLNCDTALNLDGGGSSSLYLQNQNHIDSSLLNFFQRRIDHAIIALPRP